jgi:hypothetical protein
MPYRAGSAKILGLGYVSSGTFGEMSNLHSRIKMSLNVLPVVKPAGSVVSFLPRTGDPQQCELFPCRKREGAVSLSNLDHGPVPEPVFSMRQSIS